MHRQISACRIFAKAFFPAGCLMKYIRSCLPPPSRSHHPLHSALSLESGTALVAEVAEIQWRKNDLAGYAKYSVLCLFLSHLILFIFVNENRINKRITIQNYDRASKEYI
jgi:hypothetical protein